MAGLFPSGTIARRGVLRLAAMIAAGAAGAGRGLAQATATIGIDNFAFTPDVLTVAPGTTVTWVNRDDIPHLIVCLAAQAKSPALDTDDAFAFRFATAGRYEYFCTLHPHMRGVVIVTG